MQVQFSAKEIFNLCQKMWRAGAQKRRDERLKREIYRREKELEKALRKNGMSMLLSPDYISLATQQAYAEARLNSRR